MSRFVSLLRAVVTCFSVSVALPLAAWLTLGIPDASAQCVDYKEFQDRLISLAGNRTNRIESAGEFAYVASGSTGVLVADVSNPYTLRPIRFVDTGTYAFDLAIQGDLMYVADIFGLTILDLSGPSAPIVVSSLRTDGVANLFSVEVVGDIAYVGGVGTLGTVDVSDPAHPVALGHKITGAWHYGVSVHGSHVYAGAEFWGLAVFDVQDPTSPQLVQVLDVPGQCGATVVRDGLLFVTTGDSGLRVYDLADPASPQLVAETAEEIPVSFRSLKFVGDDLYCPGSGIDIVDVSNPLAPALRRHIPAPAGNDVLVLDPWIHLALRGTGGVVTIHLDHADPPDPLLGSVDLPGLGGGRIAHHGGISYVTSELLGLLVVDVSDPTEPVFLTTVSSPTGARSAVVQGDIGYVAEWAGGLRILDLTVPSSPVTLATIDTPGWASGIVVDDNTAYVADLNFGVQVIDVSDPAAPALVGTIPTGGFARELTAWGDHLLVGTEYGSGGLLEILDLSAPGGPAPVGVVDLGEDIPTEILVRSGLAYMTCRSFDGESGTFRIIGLQDPTAPVEMATFPTTGSTKGLELDGTHIHVGDSSGRVLVLDVSNPTNPVQLGRVLVPGPGDLVRTDSGILVSDARGLRVYPPQCPGPVPVLVSGFRATATGRSVELAWSTSFESRHDGFHVYRSDRLDSGYSRLNPTLVQGRSPYSYVDPDVLPLRTYYYRLDAVDGFGNEVPSSFTSVSTSHWDRLRTDLAGAAPNPFRRTTEVTFTLQREQRASLAIYDVSGRLVRRLVRGDLPSGEHRIAWDGRNDLGAPVSAGTYFARLDTPDGTSSRKIVHVRGR